MSNLVAPDAAERARALDPRTSFIVQAPAGSGKTELLIQRYLVLLAHVEQPEEIAAITFTRKSAAEMRKRVLDALADARSGERPEEAHRAMTWDRARAALARDAEKGWGLESNSARLRVQTIDALCVSLTRQMPVLSCFGAQPENLDDATALYREAALATVELVDSSLPVAEDMAALLAHLDNDVSAAADLIVDMLAKRDQWLRAITQGLDRDYLEQGLAEERQAALRKLERAFEGVVGARPSPGAGVDAWLAFADSLLTRQGEWRKRSPEAMALEAREDGEALRAMLQSLAELPPASYDDGQWLVLGVLARILPVAAAQLRLVFAARGQADFVEIARGAIEALGPPDRPTDLMLALDYRIQHLLVDEFQDTSYTQFELLERLTGGWQAGDGRTLFLVGDPMQSIYRFREAEVSLFLRARARGLGTVPLEPLTLTSNFRSQGDIVEWVNSAFSRVLPANEDLNEGAVPYSPSEPVEPAGFDGGVSVHAFFNCDAQGEAAQVVTLVEQARAADPQGSVAVLVRNRAHLATVVPALRAAGLRFRAIEIETLGERPVVQDLIALTRAISHPADRTAWLALLRAPWCGMTLTDLHALAGSVPPTTAPLKAAAISGDLFPETLAGSASSPNVSTKIDNKLVLEAMRDAARVARLSPDGRQRLERVLEVVGAAVANRLRGSLRTSVESAWIALGGPACVTDDTALEDASTFLDYLERSEQAGELADPAALERGLAKLYALPDLHAEPSDVQLLTIHKAKGLEFDTVIVPGLGARPRLADRQLLVWLERTGVRGGSRLLLAPIRRTGGERDPIYRYLARQDAGKESHEEARLLYVAATRAKHRLHLLGDTACTEETGERTLQPPSSRSLLEKLWPAVEEEFHEQAAYSPAALAQEGSRRALPDQRLRRVPSAWRAPEPPAPVAWTAPADPLRLQDAIEFSWAGETARRVGTVVHRWLQRIAEDALEGWTVERIDGLRESVLQELAVHGVARGELPRAADRVIAALRASIEDQRGRWTLGPRRDARSELRLASMIDGRPSLLVIDRVFTDEDGRRWIVDFKTSAHEGADKEAFLDRERERYAAQLEAYARVLGWKDAMLGLYFPLLGGWREWSSGA